MRAESRASPAMTAYNRLICLIVEVYRPHNTCLYAFFAAYTFFRRQCYASAGAFLQRVAPTHFHTSRLPASEAYDRNEPAAHTTCRTHFNSAFFYRMILVDNYGAGRHARKTAEAFIHISWPEYFRHLRPPSAINSFCMIVYIHTSVIIICFNSSHDKCRRQNGMNCRRQNGMNCNAMIAIQA
jgi:hypothetical protein